VAAASTTSHSASGAPALKKMLLIYGATEIQIETVSFGKEKPRREGHDEGPGPKSPRRDRVRRE
jgi:hypothetical protein